MLVIFEGCDGTGKSTLAAEVADLIQRRHRGDEVEVRHCGPLPTGVHPLDAYERPLYDYRPGTGRHVIYDRHWLGEWIYPQVLGRPSVANSQTHLHIQMFLRSRGAVLVHTDPPVHEVERNLVARGDDLLTQLQVNRVMADYRLLVRNVGLPKVVLSTYGVLDAAEKIVGMAETHERLTKRLNPFVTYIGPPTPEYLLLGDVRHPLSKVDLSELSTGATESYGPAFGPYPGTSGEYLFDTVVRANYTESIGVANACDVDDIIRLRDVLGHPRTVALGARAHKALRASTGVSFAAAPHPQYWRRFHHHHRVEYTIAVARAMRDGSNNLKVRP
jgi:hypothetical protein